MSALGLDCELLYSTLARRKSAVVTMPNLGLALVVLATCVWVVYMALRLAPAIQKQWNVWGEILAFLVFVTGEILILLAFLNF